MHTFREHIEIVKGVKYHIDPSVSEVKALVMHSRFHMARWSMNIPNRRLVVWDAFGNSHIGAMRELYLAGAQTGGHIIWSARHQQFAMISEEHNSEHAGWEHIANIPKYLRLRAGFPVQFTDWDALTDWEPDALP